MQQIADAIEADDEKEAESKTPDSGGKPKTAPKGKKPRKANVTVDAARVAKLSKEAQKAYADLARLVWPEKRTLDAAAEAKLLAKFKQEGIELYPAGERFERAQRLATEAVVP
jgi:TRAP-type C4-dicarboxylate transport system substrate-binding protein